MGGDREWRVFSITIHYSLPPIPYVSDLDRLGTLNHIRYMDRDFHGILADNRTRTW
jgi:hypothetical protein